MLGIGLGLTTIRGAAASGPALSLDFLSGALDSRITFTRGTTGTYFDNTGALQTAAINTPRFDYDPVTLAPKGLLIEEARTNLLTYSSDWTNAAWRKTNVTVTAAATTSPDGTVNAQKLEATATAVANNLSGSIVVAATSATYSIYVKQGTGATIANNFALRNITTATTLILGTLNYASGVWTYSTGSTGVTVSNAGNGWWRLQISATTGITSGDSLSVYVGFVGGAATAGDFLYAYGAQLEAGAFATSYIPTVASTVTRSADVATMTGTNFSSWYNQSAGTFVFSGGVRGSPGASTVNFVQASNGVSVSVAIELGMFDLSGPIFQVTDGTTQASLDLGSMPVDTAVKMAGAYKVNDFAGVLNGGTVQTDAVGSVPTGITQMGIGNRLGGVYMNGWLRSITYYPDRLSNTQLQSLTA